MAIIVLGLGLRLHTLGAKSLWLDESFSLWMISRPLGDFWRYAADLDLHPPLYYLLLRAWTVFGDGEVALRSFSVLCGVATIPVAFAIGSRLRGRALGLGTAAVFSVSPLNVQFAQQARMYSLVTLFAAAALLSLLHVLGVDGGEPRRRSTVTRWWWVAFVLATTGAMLTHNVAAALLVLAFAVAIGGVAVARYRTRGERPADSADHRCRAAALGLLSAVVLWSPWAIAFLDQGKRVAEEFWIPPVTAQYSIAFWREIGSGDYRADDRYVLAVALLFIILAMLGAWSFRGSPPALVIICAVVLVPFVGEQLVSIGRSIFYTRTLIWITPAFSVLVAAGIGQLRYRILIAAAAAGVLVVTVLSFANYYEWKGQEDWRAAAAYVVNHARDGDIVLLSAGWTQLPFDYYTRESGLTLPEYGLPVNLFGRGTLEPIMRPSDTPRMDGLVAGRSRVWLLYSHAGYADPDGLVPGHLATVMTRIDDQEYSGLRVQLYQPK